MTNRVQTRDKRSKVMKIREAIFAGSSTDISGQPKRRLPEFAFIGRSNVGKSSLINMLAGNRKLAMTSSTPGKTRLVNHFIINDSWYLVDLPGYGFAKGSRREQEKIHSVISNYLSRSEDMVMLFVLLDSRHEMGQADRDLLAELGENGIPFAIVFTKADKMGVNALAAVVETNKKCILEMFESLPPVFITSSEKASGKEELLRYISEVLANESQTTHNI